ncbi:MAG TPA: hypothetical protein VK858_08275 [Longimicrobiales bacterium]|nr:hypothetical protein [Longimicrobiales bacterium]
MSDATARGLDVRLRVGLENREAMELYLRLGFTTVQVSDTHRRMSYTSSAASSPRAGEDVSR